MRLTLPTKQLEDYLRESFGKLSQQQMSEYLNLSRSQVAHLLGDLGLRKFNRRGKDEPRCNPSIFTNIPLMNYIYGYVAGDGSYNTTHDPYCYVDIDSNEEQIITDLNSFIQSSKKIGFYQGKIGKPMHKLSVSDSTFVSSCLAHGLVKRKSTSSVAMFPDPGYESHFLRGLLDSDGYVSLGNPSTPKIGFLGQPIQLEVVRNVLLILIELPKMGISKENYAYQQVNRPSDITKVMDYLYQDAFICNKRKQSIYLDWRSS